MDNMKPLKGGKRKKTEATGAIRRRWALLVGVNKYVDPNIPSLWYCVNDVLAMEQVLQKANYTVIALHDQVKKPHLLPTHPNVEAELVRLCQVAQPDDLLLLYFSGHGQLVNDQACLITRETRYPNLARWALPLSNVERIMRENQVRRRVIILDACHSGVEMTRDLALSDEFIHSVYELAEGSALLAATTAQDKALENRSLKHGVFTHTLLKGFEGQADRDGKDFVTVSDLHQHVLNALREWCIQTGRNIQTPTARIEGVGDMILADYRTAITQNPFGDRGRITDPKRFFDRKELMRQIFEELGKGMSVSLVGEREIGKSSILSMICEWGAQELKLPREAFAYLSMQWVHDEEEFYEALCDALHIKSSRGYKLTRALRSSGKRYVLCLDEIEKMSWDGFSKRIRSHLRGLADGHDAPLTLVIASRLPLADLFSDSHHKYNDSPLANLCHQLDVGPFSPQIARNFLLHRLRGTNVTFSDPDINLLLTHSGGHPAKLQALAAKLFRHLTQPTK
ncbi:MAG: caspase family protein [Ardenticatenaceae bacterium]